MPVVLRDAVVDAWLDPADPKPLVPAAEEVLVYSEASRKVNWVKNEGLDLLVAS